MSTAKIRFTVDAGRLTRGSVLGFLNELKSQITWNEPNAIVSITETKGFLESHFEFQAHNLSEVMARAVHITVDKVKGQCAEGAD